MILEWLLWSTVAASDVVRCTMVSLPSVTFIEDPSDSCARTTYRAQFPRCKPATPAIKKLNRIIEKRSRDAALYDDAVKEAPEHSAKSIPDCDEIETEISGECELPYQVRSILSFKCRRNWSGLRSGSSPFAINVDIANGRIKELELPDLLEPAAEDRLWALVREDLKQQKFLDDAGEVESETGPLAASRPAFNLTPAAVLLDFGYHFGAQYVTVEIPYSSLDRILKRRFMPQAAPPNSRFQRTSPAALPCPE
jgi:hypothetical protein